MNVISFSIFLFQVLRHSGHSKAYRHEYLTVQPNTLDRNEDKKDATNNSEKNVLETEDLFGDKDSDDDDPSAETFLESRSVNVNTEIADNQTPHQSNSLLNNGDDDVHRNDVNNETEDFTVGSSSAQDDSLPNPVLSVIKDEPGLVLESSVRSSNKREREE